MEENLTSDKKFFRMDPQGAIPDQEPPGEEDELDAVEEGILGSDNSSGDTDGDGMPDRYEAQYRDVLDINDNDANQDPDGDGLTNLQEYQLGINPGTANQIGPVNFGFEEVPTVEPDLSFRPEHSASGQGYPSDLYANESIPGWAAPDGAGSYIEIWDEGDNNPYAELQSHWGAHGLTQTFDMLPGSQFNFILRYKGRYEYDPYDNAFTIEVEGAVEVLVNGNPAQAEGTFLMHSFMADDEQWDQYADWHYASISIASDPAATALEEITISLKPENTESYGEEITYGGFVDLIPIELTWEKIDGDYPDLEDNINPFTQEVQGQRIFPGKKTPTDSRRNKVTLKVDVGIPNAQVYVKAFDVDDPTPKTFDTNDEVDPNDSSTEGVGDDNREDHVIPSGKEAGFFTTSGTATANMQSNAEGIAEFEFNVGMQPGNNYRVVASVFNEDVYADVQVTDPSANGYLGPDEDDTPTPASPLLTVWRKLHLEVDSMEAPPEKTQRESPDNITATGVSWALNTPISGQSTLTVDGTLEDDADFYEAGEIISGSTSFRIISNTDNLISDDQIVIEGVPSGTEQALFIGQSFEIVDDDDWQVSDIGLPNQLPKHGASGAIIDVIQPRYDPAYIEIVDTNDLNLNPNKTIQFESNAKAATVINTSVFDDALDVAQDDEKDFWAFGLVFGYQPDGGQDSDPTGTLAMGGTPEGGAYVGLIPNKPWGFTVVWMESIREKVIGSLTPLPEPLKENFKNQYLDWFHGVVAHEIGHAPGRGSESADHNEEGLMQEGASTIQAKFTPKTITRFRDAKSWRE